MKNTLKLLLGCVTVLGGMILFSSSESKPITAANQDESIMAFQDAYRIAMPPIPAEFDFCGEKVPLENWEVKERLEREVLSNTYWQSNMMLLLKRSGRYFNAIDAILEEEGVPTDFKYLAVAESGLTQPISSAGARGMWQFMKTTGISYGLTISGEIDERYHVEKSTRAACAYLKKAKAQLGSWTLAAAAYNRGLAGITRDRKNQRVDNYYGLHLNTETSRYVFRILAFKLIMSNPNEYGFQLETADYYQPVDVDVLAIDSTIWNLPDFAKENNTDYKTVKALNPWLRDDHLTVKPGKVYYLKLPRS